MGLQQHQAGLIPILLLVVVAPSVDVVAPLPALARPPLPPAPAQRRQRLVEVVHQVAKLHWSQIPGGREEGSSSRCKLVKRGATLRMLGHSVSWF